MRRALATVVLVLSAVVGLPADGPRRRTHQRADHARRRLGRRPLLHRRGVRRPRRAAARRRDAGQGDAAGGGIDYNLTWMIHDVSAWRWDRVRVSRDGTAWVSTNVHRRAPSRAGSRSSRPRSWRHSSPRSRGASSRTGVARLGRRGRLDRRPRRPQPSPTPRGSRSPAGGGWCRAACSGCWWAPSPRAGAGTRSRGGADQLRGVSRASGLVEPEEEVRRHGAQQVPGGVPLQERRRVAPAGIAEQPDGEGDEHRGQRDDAVGDGPRRLAAPPEERPPAPTAATRRRRERQVAGVVDHRHRVGPEADELARGDRSDVRRDECAACRGGSSGPTPRPRRSSRRGTC